MKLPSNIRFADEKLKIAFYKLEAGNDSEKKLFKSINKALDKIEENSFCGIPEYKYQKNSYLKNT